MTTTREVIACARRFLGVRFAHQGRTADGLDCLGLLLLTARELDFKFSGEGVDALDVPNYGTWPDAVALKQKLDTHLTVIDANAVQEADIVLLKILGRPQHLALLSDYPIQGELSMIHAYAGARQVVEHRYDRHWREQAYAAYRLPQLINIQE